MKHIREESINRLEIINHASNDKPTGRLLVLLKELGHFDTLDFELQDDNKTLKIFLNTDKNEKPTS